MFATRVKLMQTTSEALAMMGSATKIAITVFLQYKSGNGFLSTCLLHVKLPENNDSTLINGKALRG